MMSVPSGRCGPCCSVAASGSTAIQRAGSVVPISGQRMAVQSRGGVGRILVYALEALVCVRPGTELASPKPAYHEPERPTESNYEPGLLAASVNHCRCFGMVGSLARCGSRQAGPEQAGPNQTGQGVVRNQLGGRGGARRVFPGLG